MSYRASIVSFPEIKEPLLNKRTSRDKNKIMTPAPFDACDLEGLDTPETLPEIPDVSQVETIRHFTRLSRLNFGIDQGMYPLGSCTMKHNPRICEEIASKMARIHPADDMAMSGILEKVFELSGYLEEICGMDASTLWPAAGAHGELTAIMIIKKALYIRGEPRRTVLIPDTAHGTNPASCAVAGFRTVNIPSGDDGMLKASILKEYLDGDVAGLMITNPNTLGIFENEIRAIAAMLHENGSYLYMDGANLNAIMGITRPGDMGVDIMHLNLHKTFGTPHGGGGPGSGPVLVKKGLVPFLPLPDITHTDNRFSLGWNRDTSIGMVHSSTGNMAVLIKALTYIYSLGAFGIRQAATMACINANYLRARLSPMFNLPYPGATLHEFVLSDRDQEKNQVTTMDMAKALMDYGFHPPTVYFPLVVHGAIMIEPTETEPLEELERFAQAMQAIAETAQEHQESLHNNPVTCPCERVDEVWAARNLVLTWDME